MIGRLVPFTEINDFKPAAMAFREGLVLPENNDICQEFPVAGEKYTTDLKSAIANLQEVKQKCLPGKREQFIVMAEQVVAGMAVVQLVEDAPGDVSSDWPNVSGFVMHEWRREGLGSLSLRERLEVVDSNFGGHAWTLVRNKNKASKRLVESCGFKQRERIGDKTLYSYSKSG